MAKRGKGEQDLFHGQGNSTVGMPMKVTNKAGRTDPEQKNAGNLTKTTRKTAKGWNK